MNRRPHTCDLPRAETLGGPIALFGFNDGTQWTCNQCNRRWTWRHNQWSDHD